MRFARDRVGLVFGPLSHSYNIVVVAAKPLTLAFGNLFVHFILNMLMTHSHQRMNGQMRPSRATQLFQKLIRMHPCPLP
eukprot:2456750-Amphidinium_carterae.1